MRCERDAFDALFDCDPAKLGVVKKVYYSFFFLLNSCWIFSKLNNSNAVWQSLVTFVNKHLNKLNFEVHDLNTDFKDGVYLCIMMGLLGGFFVPLHSFHLTPKDTDQMVSLLYLILFYYTLMPPLYRFTMWLSRLS